ncbi:MAG: hypothetical protein J6W29_07465 [Neisseriaceae bacterium]|nr:hypothetical protein [Neisseriaceae bacterium]
MNHFKKMCILFALCIFSLNVYAKTIIDDEKIMNQAVSNFYQTYRQFGIQGNIAEIKKCYKDKKQKQLYCFYYDYLARIVDMQMTSALGAPNDPFFDDKNFHDRITKNFYFPIYESKGINESNFDQALEETNKHLMEVYQSLSDKFYKEIEKEEKKSKNKENASIKFYEKINNKK